MTSASGNCLSSCLLSCCRRAAAQQQRRMRYRLLESCFSKKKPALSYLFWSLKASVTSCLSLQPKPSQLSLSALLSSGGAAGGSAVSVLLCALVTQHQQWDSDHQGEWLTDDCLTLIGDKWKHSDVILIIEMCLWLLIARCLMLIQPERVTFRTNLSRLVLFQKGSHKIHLNVFSHCFFLTTTVGMHL